MTTITQVITTLPAAPDPATQTPAEFSTTAAAYVLAQKDMVPELNTWAGQVNTVAAEVNANAATATAQASNASASALAAENSAVIAAALSNLVGEWSALSGAKTMPLSVTHDGAYWALLENTADVTADEPGVSGKWGRAYGLGQITQRSSNVKFVAEDSGKIFEYTSGTFTQTFDPAATLGANWFVYLKNAGANVTLDPDGSETIDKTTIGHGQLYLVICTGTAFRVVDCTPAPTIYGISEPFESSGTFTAKKSGWHRVTAVGAGGSGGVAWNDDAATVLSATGGAAGGFAVKEFWALAGTAYTIVIGTGGTAVSRTTDGATSGNAGGNTTFSGFGVSITANGGAGGTASIVATTLTGAAGGTATGGDLNVTGGASGGVANTSSSGGRGASGGGAVGVRGTSYASGAVTVSGGSAAHAASGGAGIGGASGTATSTAGQTSASGGGGSLGSSSAAANNNTTGGAGASSLTTLQLNATGSAGSSSSSIPAPDGNGGAGGGAIAGVTDNVAGAGKLYAGGGGRATQASGSGISAGTGGRGGGGGGAAMYASSGSPDSLSSGAGGSGLVIVEY